MERRGDLRAFDLYQKCESMFFSSFSLALTVMLVGLYFFVNLDRTVGASLVVVGVVALTADIAAVLHWMSFEEGDARAIVAARRLLLGGKLALMAAVVGLGIWGCVSLFEGE